MNDATRLAALQATAKVALSLTVLGCAARVDVKDGDDTKDGDDAYQPPRADDTDPEPPPMTYGPIDDRETYPEPEPEPERDPLVCEAPPPPGEPVMLGNDQLQCCVAALEPVLPKAGATQEEWDAWSQASADPEVQGCCNVVIAHVDAQLTDPASVTWEQVDWDTATPCCEPLGWPFGGACTPWGPPAPPSFDAALAADWRLA